MHDDPFAINENIACKKGDMIFIKNFKKKKEQAKVVKINGAFAEVSLKNKRFLINSNFCLLNEIK